MNSYLFHLTVRVSAWRRVGLLRSLMLLMGVAAASLLLAALCRPAYAAVGQPSFEEPHLVGTAEDDRYTLSWSSLETDATYCVAWGDYDGDGDLDLVTGTDHQNRLYRNDGSFEAKPQMTLVWSSTEEDDTRSVAWADVDLDGDLDLVAGNYGDPNRLYRNDNGTLTSSAVWSSRETEPTRSIAWGDMDGDGYFDLAVANAVGPDQIYRNDGGALATTASYATVEISNTYSVAWGDVDGDGDLDLAVGIYPTIWGPPEKVLIYRNDKGAITDTIIQTIGPGYFRDIAWADYDGDGDCDLATVGGAGIQLYRNDGGTLTSDQTIPDVSGRKLAWGDYDADGDLDLVTAISGLSYGAQLYRNDDGTFTTSAVWASSLGDRTYGVAWGDYDGDGDLDLVVGNQNEPDRLYRNDSATLSSDTAWESAEDDATFEVAWGDSDGDGDLDLLAGNAYSPPANDKLYRNDSGTLTASPTYSTSEAAYTFSVAWGDYDGDGDLDPVSGRRLYRNDDGTLTAEAVFTAQSNEPESVAWGDYDGDGDLDLALGIKGGAFPERNLLFRNDNGVLSASHVYSTTESDYTTSLAWGDVDGDGDLDLAVGNRSEPDRLYRNDRGMLTASAVYSTTEVKQTKGLAWGDVDGDGDLDLAAGGTFVRLYRNESGTLTANASWISLECESAGVAWGDYDGDGDLDLAAAGYRVRLYRNDDGELTARAVWSADGVYNTNSVAWGDVDGDGDLDLAADDALFLNTRDGQLLSGSIPVVSVARPGPSAGFFSDPHIWSGPVIPITYTLSDPEGDPVKAVRAFYSPDGGGRWFPAAAASGTVTANLATTATYTYNWDVLGSGFFGQSDNVVFRLVAVPEVTPAPNGTPGPYLYGSYASQTFPFRVRGTQVRVMRRLDGGTVPAPDATVYRLPAGQSLGGLPIADQGGEAFRTDLQGYLQGRGQLEVGDRLFALVPVTWTDSYTLYYTSGEPTNTGVDAFTVATSGVQTLTVSADNPLILFNLDVSLEWDAHNEPAYLEQLRFSLQRASEYLYDFTDGQVALGDVEVFQDANEWAYTHIVVNANNRLRPYAIQGGIVTSDTIDPDHSVPTDTILYSPGQVTMGSTWNRYGDPGKSLGEDWAIILAHELSHYLLFHDDVYLGMDANGFLISVDTCQGSAMGDLYNDPDNTEFIADQAYWQAHCSDTLPEQTLGRNEWETMHLWYPQLITPTAINPGPSTMPFDFTTVQANEPYTPSETLVDPTFFIDYEGGGGSSSEARAYLVRDEYVVNLGSPFGGQNRVIAHGAGPGDRLCVFDRSRAQFGCETVETGDDRLAMRQDEDWNPIILISPINTTTVDIDVSGAPASLPLRARIFPDLGEGEDPIALAPSNGVYTGTFNLTYPAMNGNIQVWVDEAASEDDPRRETIIAYSIGGNSGFSRAGGGFSRAGGGFSRAGGGFSRAGGGFSRAGGAPIVSPDGQMIFFTENPIEFTPGTFFTIQSMAGLPPLPAGRTLVGQGYNLVGSPGHPLPSGSVSIQYLSNDVRVAGANEADLGLYFWNGSQWTMLDTVLDTYYNLASAPDQGEGIYALMASVQIGLTGPGWNLVSYPIHGTQLVTEALLSIQGMYTTVYGYEPDDAGGPAGDPWKVYDVTVPNWVNDLSEMAFGKGYWINASQSVTLHLKSETALTAAGSKLQLPPSTFYGTVLAGGGFNPTAGMNVTAWADDVFCGQGQTQYVANQIVYVVDVFADGGPAGPTAGCGAPGQSVRFEVDGRDMSPTAAWDNRRLWSLDLSPAMSPPGGWYIYLPLVRRGGE